MKYDFDHVTDRRGTNSMKWDPETCSQFFGQREILPFWVADMDFRSAPPIVDAVVERARHGIYGYSVRTDSYYEAAIGWVRKRFGFKLKREWLQFSPGIVPAINHLIQAICVPGDKVVIQEPVYYPFRKAIENNGCHVVNNPLTFNGTYYEMDFEDLEEKLRDPLVKALILCSPHNPVSRVWNREELERLGNLCLESGVIIIADEIHSDLVYSGYRHTMFPSLNQELAMNSVTCTSVSKTFNLAGMQCSNIIIPNPHIMEKYRRVLEKNNVEFQNPFSIVAAEAAYRECEDWLEELLAYLEGNIALIRSYLGEHLPQANFIDPQATYLGWIDFREYERNGKKLESLMYDKARVGMDSGLWFGEGGEGFMRLNFACPRRLLEEGLKRICSVF